jgi:preprotein translocase subunit SecF
MELFRTKTHIDFVKAMPLMVVFSLIVIVGALVCIAVKGFNFSIDFAGGTVIEAQVPASAGDVDEQRLREIMEKLGQPDAVIVRLGDPEDREFRISLRGSQETDRDLSLRILKGINEALGTEVVAKSVESWAARRRRAAPGRRSSCLIGILLYVWFRFDGGTPGAVLALIDTSLRGGLFSFFGWEFDMNVLAALW